MKTFYVFDLDDTLYDRAQPFQRAAEDVLGNRIADLGGDARQWYRIYREASDELFDLLERKEMSLPVYRVRRILLAMDRCGQRITEDMAGEFQRLYEKYQGEIALSPVMKKVLDFCSAGGNAAGIMTNGPSAHQRKKTAVLGLERWCRPEHIWISEEAGAAKPDERIFRRAEADVRSAAASGDSPREDMRMCMIGDSYPSDMQGAMGKGWMTVWLNKDHEPVPEGSRKPDIIVFSEEELLAKLKLK